jgi:hypothetical protein
MQLQRRRARRGRRHRRYPPRSARTASTASTPPISDDDASTCVERTCRARDRKRRTSIKMKSAVCARRSGRAVGPTRAACDINKSSILLIYVTICRYVITCTRTGGVCVSKYLLASPGRHPKPSAVRRAARTAVRRHGAIAFRSGVDGRQRRGFGFLRRRWARRPWTSSTCPCSCRRPCVQNSFLWATVAGCTDRGYACYDRHRQSWWGT